MGLVMRYQEDQCGRGNQSFSFGIAIHQGKEKKRERKEKREGEGERAHNNYSKSHCFWARPRLGGSRIPKSCLRNIWTAPKGLNLHIIV